jgi:hypothetical protein
MVVDIRLVTELVFYEVEIAQRVGYVQGAGRVGSGGGRRGGSHEEKRRRRMRWLQRSARVGTMGR